MRLCFPAKGAGFAVTFFLPCASRWALSLASNVFGLTPPPFPSLHYFHRAWAEEGPSHSLYPLSIVARKYPRDYEEVMSSYV